MSSEDATEGGVRPARSFDDAPMGEGPVGVGSGSGSGSRRTRAQSADLEINPSSSGDDLLKTQPSDDSSVLAPLVTEDYELRVAKEMALAIQQNPHLTPAELKELRSKTEQKVAVPPPMRTPSSQGRSGKSPLLKSLSKGVKSSVKKAFSHATPDRTSISAAGTGGASGSPTQTSSSSARGERKLGDFLESGSSPKNSGSNLDHSETDNDTHGVGTVGTATGNIRITGIIWKRRSGLGKYSTSGAWERRRVVLMGSKLYYYRTKVDKRDGDDGASGDEMELDDGGGGGGSSRDFKVEGGAAAATTAGTPSKSKSWLEQMGAVKTSSRGKDARGYLDLVKENASVGASFGHSGSPTPFALSIKILAQTKWKLCFDTHGELMQWLAAMTDVIVQGSVDSYNSLILAANDPSRVLEPGYHGQLSEPPLIANSGTKSKVGGHRLWVAGQYNIQSENYLDDHLEEVTEGDSEDDESDDDATVKPRERKATTNKGIDADAFVLALQGGRDIWGVPAQYIWQWGLLWNVVIILARSSSTSVESFWYLITFANIALFGFMNKESVGGTVNPDLIVSRKMAHRLSNGLGGFHAPSSKGKGKSADSAIPEPPMAAVKPKAGSTTMRIENPMDLPVNKDGQVFAGWRYANPKDMMIRSHNYKKDKIKVPSPGELYKCVHADIFEARTRFPDMASRVELPEVTFNDEGPKTWNAPDTFVVSIAIPTDPPKLYSSAENGGGYTVTMYFVMHEDTREILKRVTADGYNPKDEKADDPNTSKINAVRLLDEWCRRAPTDDAFCARFKVVPNAQNLKEIGLPSWIGKYNGKPFLIKRPGQTGFLYRHPDKSCIEFDISLHPFPYLAKQGICFMKDAYFKKVLVTFGFLIEGRAEDELPECLIGLMQLCYPDPVHAIQGEDLMAGTSAKSFE